MEDERRVGRWFEIHGARFGLLGHPVLCRAVLNLGGFVNRSFTVADGRRLLHVKLASAENAPGLRRWATLHRRLETDHRAPRLLGAIEGTDMAGEALALIFEHVPGRAPNPLRDRAALVEALAAAAALHGDRGLEAALGGPGEGRTCADDLIETYVDRLRADMEVVVPAVLDFLPDGFAAWARREIDALEAAARDTPAFAAPAAAVVHGDLHTGNLLLGEDGRLWLLDWDDLHAGGDGALDAANLLRPLLLRGGGEDLFAAYARLAGDPGAAERVPLYCRAMLLDEVVDSLADFVEAEALPGHREAVRTLKRNAHSEALAAYRREYGD